MNRWVGWKGCGLYLRLAGNGSAGNLICNTIWPQASGGRDPALARGLRLTVFQNVR
jgi:hypothetical protein